VGRTVLQRTLAPVLSSLPLQRLYDFTCVDRPSRTVSSWTSKIVVVVDGLCHSFRQEYLILRQQTTIDDIFVAENENENDNEYHSLKVIDGGTSPKTRMRRAVLLVNTETNYRL